jgi:hypothetical protein
MALTGLRPRLLRLVPATLAAYELRRLFSVLIGAAAHAGSGHPTELTLLALIGLVVMAGLILRESASGLAGRLPRAAWSLRLIATWLLGSAAIAALLGAAGLTDHGLASENWVGAVPAVLAGGLLLAVSARGAIWLLRDTCGLSPRLELSLPSPLRLLPHAPSLGAVAPLRAGWSGRGPPWPVLVSR